MSIDLALLFIGSRVYQLKAERSKNMIYLLIINALFSATDMSNLLNLTAGLNSLRTRVFSIKNTYFDTKADIKINMNENITSVASVLMLLAPY